MTIKNLASTISTLNDTINKMNIAMQNKDYEIKKLILEIERLKNNNNQDSSNVRGIYPKSNNYCLLTYKLYPKI